MSKTEGKFSLEKEGIFETFNEISSTYDKINGIISLGKDKSWRNKLSKHLNKDKPLTILDLATGTGVQVFSILEKNNNIKKAIGTDLSSGMLSIAKKNCEEKEYKDKVSFMIGDAQKLDFSDESFDATTMSFGIRNIDNLSQCFDEIYRVLKPGGQALFLEHSLPQNKLIKPLYLGYTRYILPKIGKALSNHKTAYRYLNETIEDFPTGKSFCKLLKQAKFSSVNFYPMMFGSVTLYEGIK